MTRYHTAPPRPDIRTRVAAAAAILLAIWGYAGALGLMFGLIDFGPTIDARLPWGSLPVAGVALLLVVAVPMTVAAVSAWRAEPTVAETLVLTGAVQIGWVAVQLAVIRSFSWLQPVCAGLGLLIAVIGWRLWVSRGRRTGGTE